RRAAKGQPPLRARSTRGGSGRTRWTGAARSRAPPQEQHEERRTDESGDGAYRRLGAQPPEEQSRDGVGDDEKGGAAQGGGGEHHPVIRTGDEAHRVWNDEADEADEPGESDGRADCRAGGEERNEPGDFDVDAERSR